MESLDIRILDQIQKANINIKIAVAWLTDLAIIDKLKIRLKEGIDIDIIISGSEWNLLRINEYEEIIKLGGMIEVFGSKDVSGQLCLRNSGFCFGLHLVLFKQLKNLVKAIDCSL